jgi:hypothetical protein
MASNTSNSILRLTLQRKPFEVMLSGEKKSEYRKNSDWIRSRLFDRNNIFRHYELIQFTNGYNSDSPFFACEFKGVTIVNYTMPLIQFSNGLIVDNIVKGDFIIHCGMIVFHGNLTKELSQLILF